MATCQPLQLPFIPDPGKVEDLSTDVKLDFSVRLGTSLARERQGTRMQFDLSMVPNSNQQPKQSLTPSPRISHHRKSKAAEEGSSRVRKESSKLNKTISSMHLPSPVVSEKAVKKFQRVMRTVRIILQVCIALKRYTQRPETKTWSFMEMYLHMKEDISQVVAFNPQNFARGEPESGRLKQILALPSTERTPHDIKTILALMRGNSSFQDYPTHVQVQLACCMEYQSYEARRIILKQGHRPEAFYIILSGYVMANVEERDVKSGHTFIKTVKEMGPGNTFGEIALIEGGRRTATIVCKTNVQLIVIMKEDFDNIIRKQLLKQIHEQASFCRSLALFKDFPCHLLEENPSEFFFQYFKKGDIVVRDSIECKYIVIVKAGRCLVVSSHNKDQTNSGSVISANVRRDLETAFPFYDDMQKIKNFKDIHKTEEDKRKDSVCLGLLTGKVDKTRLADHGPDVQRPKSTVTRGELKLSNQKPYVLQKSQSLTSFFTAVSKTRRERIETDNDLYSDLKDDFWSRRLKASCGKSRMSGARRQKRSGGSLRSTSAKSTRPTSCLPRQTTIAQLAEMNEGTVFGLESLVQKPNVKISLVSDGAECIFISKRFFLHHANIKVLRITTDMVQTYPPSKKIEQELKNYHKWGKYKSRLVEEIVKRKQVL